ncbi:MAG: hypothetical protein ACT4PZ_23140 [Panacagrimonas sp.]
MYKTTDMQVQQNPMPFLAWLRSTAPVWRNPETGVFFGDIALQGAQGI